VIYSLRFVSFKGPTASDAIGFYSIAQFRFDHPSNQIRLISGGRMSEIGIYLSLVLLSLFPASGP